MRKNSPGQGDGSSQSLILANSLVDFLFRDLAGQIPKNRDLLSVNQFLKSGAFLRVDFFRPQAINVFLCQYFGQSGSHSGDGVDESSSFPFENWSRVFACVSSEFQLFIKRSID